MPSSSHPRRTTIDRFPQLPTREESLFRSMRAISVPASLPHGEMGHSLQLRSGAACPRQGRRKVLGENEDSSMVRFDFAPSENIRTRLYLLPERGHLAFHILPDNECRPPAAGIERHDDVWLVIMFTSRAPSPSRCLLESSRTQLSLLRVSSPCQHPRCVLYGLVSAHYERIL